MRRSGLLVLLAVLGGLLTIGAPATANDETSPRVVRVGTEGVYPPFTYRDPDTNELTGFDVEVMKAIGEEAGWDRSSSRRRSTPSSPRSTRIGSTSSPTR